MLVMTFPELRGTETESCERPRGRRLASRERVLDAVEHCYLLNDSNYLRQVTMHAQVKALVESFTRVEDARQLWWSQLR